VQSTAGAGQEPFGDGPDRLALNLGSEAQQLDRGDLVEPLTHHDDVAGSLERASCRPWTRCLPAQPWCAPGPRAVSGRVIPVGPARGAVRHPGRHVVVESYSESHPRRPTTRAWRSSDEPTAPTSWPANVSAARRPPRTGRPHPPTSGAGGDCRCPLTPPAATSRTASRGVRLFAGHTGRVPGGLGWPVAGRGGHRPTHRAGDRPRSELLSQLGPQPCPRRRAETSPRVWPASLRFGLVRRRAECGFRPSRDGALVQMHG